MSFLDTTSISCKDWLSSSSMVSQPKEESLSFNPCLLDPAASIFTIVAIDNGEQAKFFSKPFSASLRRFCLANYKPKCFGNRLIIGRVLAFFDDTPIIGGERRGG